MPLYDFQCRAEDCALIFEGYVSLQEFPKTLSCPKCSGETDRYLMRRPPERHGGPDPVVVYQMPDGTYRFPPAIDSSSCAMYEGKGATRLEMHGWADVRRFGSRFNKEQQSEIRRTMEKRQEAFERSESARRSEVRRELEQGFQIPETMTRGDGRVVYTGRMTTVRLSEAGRAVMRAAMARNDQKTPHRSYDAGFHVEAYSNDRSNRDADPRRRGQ